MPDEDQNWQAGSHFFRQQAKGPQQKEQNEIDHSLQGPTLPVICEVAMKSQEIEEGKEKVAPARNIRDRIGLNWMDRKDQRRERGGYEAFSEPAD